MHPFIPGQTRKEKFLFLNFFHNFSHNCLLQIFIPLATTGAPGHLPKSLPMHKDEGFWLIQGLLPCNEVLSSNLPHQSLSVGAKCRIPRTGGMAGSTHYPWLVWRCFQAWNKTWGEVWLCPAVLTSCHLTWPTLQ